MIFIKAILGVIIGAILGIILFVGLTYPLFLAAEGGRDMNGGIAMGMVTGIGPLGMIVGAFSGLLFVLIRNRSKPEPKTTEEPDGRRGLWIAGIIGAFVIGYFGLLFYLQGPPKISMQTEPDLHFEFRSPKSNLVNNDDFKPYAELFGHYDKTSVPIATNINIDEENATLSGKLHVEKGKGYEKMRLRAWFGPDLIVEATVPLYPGQEVSPGLTDWVSADYIRKPISDESELGYSQKIHMYRFQVLPHEDP